MNYVDESLDNVPRQVVPGDFSFLSLADRAIVRAMSGIVKSLTGIDSDLEPVLIGYATVKMTSPYRYKATVMYQEEIMELDVTESDNREVGVTSWKTFLEKMQIWVSDEVVSPSPVYGEGLQQNINVHKCKVMRGGYYPASGVDAFSLSRIACLPTIETSNGEVTVRPSGNVGQLESKV
jgi:hypothetical protein